MINTIIKSNNRKSEFFGTLFQARTIIHQLHLKTGSYAQHKALNEAYDEILDIADTLIESTQGLDGIIEFTTPEAKTYKNPTDYTKELYNYIKQNRGIFSESFQQNLIDEIQALLAQTLYKLINLK